MRNMARAFLVLTRIFPVLSAGFIFYGLSE